MEYILLYSFFEEKQNEPEKNGTLGLYAYQSSSSFPKHPTSIEGERKMWDFGGDGFQSFEGPCILEGANLSLEPYCLMDGDEDETIGVSSN